jgi:hypothetical protein
MDEKELDEMIKFPDEKEHRETMKSIEAHDVWLSKNALCDLKNMGFVKGIISKHRFAKTYKTERKTHDHETALKNTEIRELEKHRN